MDAIIRLWILFPKRLWDKTPPQWLRACNEETCVLTLVGIQVFFDTKMRRKIYCIFKIDLTELVFILDRSGSMGGLESDTIGGFNGMVSRQKAEGKKAREENKRKETEEEDWYSFHRR